MATVVKPTRRYFTLQYVQALSYCLISLTYPVSLFPLGIIICLPDLLDSYSSCFSLKSESTLQNQQTVLVKLWIYVMCVP